MLDFEELRKQVAITHNVLLGNDDPILVAVTLNEIVLRRYAEILSAQSEGHTVALTAALHEQAELSKKIGGRVITDAATFVSNQVRTAVAEAAAEATAKLRAELADAQAVSRASAAEAANARSARSMAVLAACVAGACAVIAVAAAVVVMVK